MKHELAVWNTWWEMLGQWLVPPSYHGEQGDDSAHRCLGFLLGHPPPDAGADQVLPVVREFNDAADDSHESEAGEPACMMVPSAVMETSRSGLQATTHTHNEPLHLHHPCSHAPVHGRDSAVTDAADDIHECDANVAVRMLEPKEFMEAS